MTPIPSHIEAHDADGAYQVRNPLLRGDENSGDFFIENGNVARAFSGQYTIAEIVSLLDDMRTVQRNVDATLRARGSNSRLPVQS